MGFQDKAIKISASFEMNVLEVINTSVGADFRLDRFEYFARWDSAAERVSMGVRSLGPQSVMVAGLGLSIAHQVIQAHQGEIQFTSEIDKGTTVRLRLPLRPGAA